MSIFGAILTATLISATPLLFAAMGEVLRQSAGVLDIGLEGEMLAGAFAAVLAVQLTGSPLAGAAAGAIGGALTGLLFALFVLRLRSDAIVVGAMVNILLVGLTSTGLRLLLSPGATMLQVKGLPILGGYPATTYAAILLVPVTAWLLGRTRLGLLTRAAGHYPAAVQSLGESVARLRLLWITVGAALAGIGGASLSIGYLNTFADNVTAGRGFVALAAVFFGRWQPIPVAVGCLLFAFFDALQLQFQIVGIGIPSDFLLVLPYAATIVIVAFLNNRVGAPRTLGETLAEDL